jgi:NADP-dependent 3-hydroxy acid dehydrogenase YdfG
MRMALPLMIIIVMIFLSSFLGHTMSNNPGFNMYAATKHAVTALAESLRRELVQLETQIRVSVSRNGNRASATSSLLFVNSYYFTIIHFYMGDRKHLSLFLLLCFDVMQRQVILSYVRSP